jgi:hypothetical protein
VLTCTVQHAPREELLGSSAGLALSVNGGFTYTALAGNLTFYSVDATFSSALASSMFGGTDILGFVHVSTAGTARVFEFQNTSVVVKGSTVTLPLELSVATAASLRFTSTADKARTVAVPFVVTLPHVEGMVATDLTVPRPRCSNATAAAAAAVPAFQCPPDSARDCGVCPDFARYPCFRASAMPRVAGRCLPARGAAGRFLAGERADLFLATQLTIDTAAATIGEPRATDDPAISKNDVTIFGMWPELSAASFPPLSSCVGW